MRNLRQKRRETSIIFRDGKLCKNYKYIDLCLLNRDKETIINLMEDFDFEERYSVIKEIINSEVVESNLRYFNFKLEPDKSFFGNPVVSTINNYKS